MKSKVTGFYRDYGKSMGFPILPSASSLFVDLLNDPDSFKNEQHDPGIYDETGDYIPQYSDDPEYISRLVSSNPSGTEEATPGPQEGNEGEAAESSVTSSESDS